MTEYKWMRTDTASIMFSCLSNKKWGRTFRMAAVFKDHTVDEEVLRKAAADIMPRYPSMHTRIRKGFFWNYQEFTDALPEIREENNRVLPPIAMRKDNRPDFRIVYYKRRIAVECAHFLGDGKGASEYFNALITRYSELCDNPDSEYILTEPTEAELSNAFAEYYIEGGEKPVEDGIEAYHIESEMEKGFIQFIFAMMKVDALHAKAKEKGMTITEYLAAALILGTMHHAAKPVDKPIVIAIPVNLRRFFPTESVRNFTIQSKVVFDTEGRTDWTFDEVCSKIAGQIKKNTAPEELQKQLNKFGGLVNNPVLKVVPNFIKQPVLRISQKKTHSGFTTILTNTGNTEVSQELADKLERVDGINGDTSGYGLVSTCSAVSCNGLFSLCFSVCGHDTSWPKECVRVLSSQGLEIRVESTHGNGGNQNEM